MMMSEDSSLTIAEGALRDLPESVGRCVRDLCDGVVTAFGARLRAIVLFGSAAEGRLRERSDVNLIFVVDAFERGAVDRVREALRAASAAVRLRPMFLLESEIPAAASAFAAKFTDILHRRRVLLGPDPFAGLAIPRAAQLGRLKQVVLNLTLRLRALYAQRSLREEQLARVLADESGPLRVAAATLLELEGVEAASPKQALESVATGTALPRTLSSVRQGEALPPGAAADAVFEALRLLEALSARVARLG
jgi:hypothetical protein